LADRFNLSPLRTQRTQRFSIILSAISALSAVNLSYNIKLVDQSGMSKKVLILVFIWIVLFSLAFILPRFIEPSGDGFTRGLNRLPAAFGLHCLGFLVALFTAALSYRARAAIKKWLLVVGFGPLVADLLLFMVLLFGLLAALLSAQLSG
jgi:hypothetical protein